MLFRLFFNVISQARVLLSAVVAARTFTAPDSLALLTRFIKKPPLSTFHLHQLHDSLLPHTLFSSPPPSSLFHYFFYELRRRKNHQKLNSARIREIFQLSYSIRDTLTTPFNSQNEIFARAHDQMFHKFPSTNCINISCRLYASTIIIILSHSYLPPLFGARFFPLASREIKFGKITPANLRNRKSGILCNATMPPLYKIDFYKSNVQVSSAARPSSGLNRRENICRNQRALPLLSVRRPSFSHTEIM